MEDFNPDDFIASARGVDTPVPEPVQASTQPPRVQGEFDPDAFDPDAFLEAAKLEKYESADQVAKTAVEGVATGVLGPIATLAQRELGVRPSDILARRETNPVTYGVGQAAGLGASLLSGVGLGGVAAKAGQGVAGITKAGQLTNIALKAGKTASMASKAAEGASIASRIGAKALDEATQMAIMQGSDEITKMLLHDPTTSAESAIANVGLAAALGGVTGAALGSIAPLWKASKEAVTMNKGIHDFASEVKIISEGADPVTRASGELTDVINNMDIMRREMGSNGLKSELLGAHMPKLSAKTTKKVKDQVNSIVDTIDTYIVDYSGNPTVGNFPKILDQYKKDLMVTILEAKTYRDGFDAINLFKNQLQGYAKAGGAFGASFEAQEGAKLAAQLQRQIRLMLEDAAVWGNAGGIQKEANAIQTAFLSNNKVADFTSTFTTKVGGESVIDPVKINTFFTQVGTVKAEIKTEVMKDFVNAYDAYATGMNALAYENGLEPIVKELPLNMVRHFMQTPSAGQMFARKFMKSLGDDTVGKSAAATVGGFVGNMSGIPGGAGTGALLGAFALTPMASAAMKGLTKNIIEKAANGLAFKSSLDFTIQAIAAQRVIDKGMKNIFKPGAQVLATHLIPDDKDRSRLDKTITELQNNPDKLLKMDNGELAHYQPEHQVALSQATTLAATYLAQIKPKPFRSSPLDVEIKPSPSEMQRYHRALDIAQQPAIVMMRIKNNTLQASDIKDLTAMYPALYNSMSQQLTNAMASFISAAANVPYDTKVGISLFLGQPMDSSMTPVSIQATQATFASGDNKQQDQQAPMQNRKGTSAMGKKTIDQTQTALQAAMREKASRK